MAYAGPDDSPTDSRDGTASSGHVPRKAEIDLCRRCDLWSRATQGVAGAGSARARIMLVGEQPGDEEDLAGVPFVGPAGRLLERALDDAGADRKLFYVTNAVKHFSWQPRGKRRIHKTPAQRQVAACRHWLEQEIAAVRPRVIVTLGATALVATVGRRIGVGEARQRELVHASGVPIIASYHPAAVLRAPDAEARAALLQSLVDDLRRALAASKRAR